MISMETEKAPLPAQDAEVDIEVAVERSYGKKMVDSIKKIEDEKKSD